MKSQQICVVQKRKKINFSTKVMISKNAPIVRKI